MPIDEFQRSILQLLRDYRSPDSYIAGGIAVHRAPESTRYSNDIDFFHDTSEATTLSSQADRLVLQQNGYTVKVLIEQPSFIRAVVSRGSEQLKLEWVRDTAFRFFPVMEDEELGYRLHDVDLAVNKCLALANRSEVRDVLDLLQLDKEVIALPAACWAACGKDPGFTPDLILDCMRRNSIINPSKLDAELLKEKLSAPALKKQWLKLLKETEALIAQYPAEDLGCVYLNSDRTVVKNPDPKKCSTYQKLWGSLGGSWPQQS